MGLGGHLPFCHLSCLYDTKYNVMTRFWGIYGPVQRIACTPSWATGPNNISFDPQSRIYYTPFSTICKVFFWILPLFLQCASIYHRRRRGTSFYGTAVPTDSAGFSLQLSFSSIAWYFLATASGWLQPHLLFHSSVTRLSTPKQRSRGG